jgi:hypothetical protein
MRIAVLLFAAFALLPAIAAAEEKKAAKNDPDRIICEKQKELGSRLAVKKICMTAAEWEVRKREDREAIDKGQMQARGPSGS